MNKGLSPNAENCSLLLVLLRLLLHYYYSSVKRDSHFNYYCTIINSYKYLEFLLGVRSTQPSGGPHVSIMIVVRNRGLGQIILGVSFH